MIRFRTIEPETASQPSRTKPSQIAAAETTIAGEPAKAPVPEELPKTGGSPKPGRKSPARAVRPEPALLFKE